MVTCDGMLLLDEIDSKGSWLIISLLGDTSSVLLGLLSNNS